MKKIITVLIALFLVFNMSAQNGINEQDIVVKQMLNNDTTVVKYLIDTGLVDDDGRKYFSYTATKTSGSVVMYKFIKYDNGWFCVRQIYTVHSDYDFSHAWEFIKSVSIFDKKHLRHYYDEGEKVDIYWMYKQENSMYIIVYEITY